MNIRINIIGGSGAGTSTLGKQLADFFKADFVDSDSLYWEESDPEYTIVRPRDVRLKLLDVACPENGNWVLSGSAVGWSDLIKDRFTHVILLSIPHHLRMERLRRRELERYGSAVLPGGERYELSKKFLEWAAGYDEGGLNTRSKELHEAWLKHIQCRAIILDSAMPACALSNYAIQSILTPPPS